MIMYKIQANASGTRSIEVSDKHLETLAKYSLLNALVDSNGIVDEPVLDKLKLNVRSLLESSPNDGWSTYASAENRITSTESHPLSSISFLVVGSQSVSLYSFIV